MYSMKQHCELSNISCDLLCSSFFCHIQLSNYPRWSVMHLLTKNTKSKSLRPGFNPCLITHRLFVSRSNCLFLFYSRSRFNPNELIHRCLATALTATQRHIWWWCTGWGGGGVAVVSGANFSRRTHSRWSHKYLWTLSLSVHSPTTRRQSIPPPLSVHVSPKGARSSSKSGCIHLQASLRASHWQRDVRSGSLSPTLDVRFVFLTGSRTHWFAPARILFVWVGGCGTRELQGASIIRQTCSELFTISSFSRSWLSELIYAKLKKKAESKCLLESEAPLVFSTVVLSNSRSKEEPLSDVTSKGRLDYTYISSPPFWRLNLV